MAAPAPEPPPTSEPIFAPLKPAFTAPPPEVTGEVEPAEPQVVAPTAATAGAPTQQYLSPAPPGPVEEASEPEVPQPDVPQPDVPEPPPGQAWVDEEAPKGP